MANGFNKYVYKTQPPCNNCKDRVLACHDTCQRYIDWKAEIKASNEKETLTHKLDDIARRRHLNNLVIKQAKSTKSSTKLQCRANKLRNGGIVR